MRRTNMVPLLPPWLPPPLAAGSTTTNNGDLRPHARESNGPEGGEDVRHAEPNLAAQAPQALSYLQ